MKQIHTILSVVYLLLMVLLPWLHMPLHGYETEESIEAHTCGHHHEPQEEEPHKGDECKLCNLVILPADLSPTLYAPIPLYICSDIQINPYCAVEVTSQQKHQARAPPFMTV